MIKKEDNMSNTNEYSEEFSSEEVAPHRSKHEAIDKASQGESDDGGGGEGGGNA